MSLPLYTDSTKSKAFRRSFGMLTILDFWITANAAHIIQDVLPLLKLGVTAEECRHHTQVTLESLPKSNVDSSDQTMHSHSVLLSSDFTF